MAPSWVSSPLFTNIIIALSINIIIVFLFPTLTNLVKSPSHPNEVQPMQPRQVSQSIPNNQQAPLEVQPVFEGNINTATPLLWEGDCFKKSKAWLELHNITGGGTVYFEVGQPDAWYCADHYLLVTAGRCVYDYFFKAGSHQIEFRTWNSQLEFEFVEKVGITLIALPSSISSAKELRDV